MLLIVGGCAPQPGSTATPSPSADGLILTSYQTQHYYAELDERTSERQVEALRRAADSGQMSYAEIEELMFDALACMDAAGASYRRAGDWAVAPGVVVPTVQLGEPDEVGQACMRKHYDYAFWAFSRQPAVVEAEDAALEERRESIVACLREQGREVEDDMPMDELLQEANDAWIDLVVAWEKMGSPPELEPVEEQFCRPHIEF